MAPYENVNQNPSDSKVRNCYNYYTSYIDELGIELTSSRHFDLNLQFAHCSYVLGNKKRRQYNHQFTHKATLGNPTNKGSGGVGGDIYKHVL